MTLRRALTRRNSLRRACLHLSAAAPLCLGLLLSPRAAEAKSPIAHKSPKVTSAIPGLKMPNMGNQIFYHVMLNQLEDRTDGSHHEFRWDGEGWIGTSMNKFWIKSEGMVRNGVVSDGDQEFLYDRPIPRMRYFDAQLGIREDLDSGPSRTWAAIGMEGLAPYFFEFAPTLYIGRRGAVAGRIDAAYDLLFTQRLIARPQAEFNFYSQNDPARGVGSGLSEIDTGIRLRYEFSRKFAPYVGLAYDGKYGDTATYARQAGESTGDPRFVFGIRAWY